MRSLRPFVYLALTLSAACGGGDSSQPTGTPINTVTNGIFRATINGLSWSAIATVIVTRPTAGSITIHAGSTSYAMTIVCHGVAGPRTISLDELAPYGSHASVSAAGNFGWDTGNTGGTGSVVITLLTASHIVGTFTFDAPESGTVGGTALHVKNGTFDVIY